MKGMKAIIIVVFLVGVTTLVRTPTAGNPPDNLAAIRGGSPQFHQASLNRGQEVFVAQCGFSHGGNATGGQSGPDLIRSVLVMNDEAGKQLGEFLKVGRPDKGMPKFDLSEEQTKDIAAFLHQRIAAVVDR